jgi:hypothetical protein
VGHDHAFRSKKRHDTGIGFAALDAAGLGELTTIHAGELREYDNRSTPRTQVSGRVFVDRISGRPDHPDA